MVAIVQREATKPWEITAQNGDHFALEVGRTYTTAKHLVEDKVVVFSNYWLRVPAECFGMSTKEQKRARLEAANDRMREASKRLTRANEELDAAEREQRLAWEGVMQAAGKK